MLNVGVVGLGFVGLTLSVVASTRKNINVYGIDKDDEILESIGSGKAHFHEQGLNRLISGSLNEKLFVSKSFDPDISYDIFVITVGTPLQKDKLAPNFDYLKQAIEEISKVYNGNQLVILRSTVSVGVTREIIIPQLNEMKKNCNPSDILVAFCPERTVEGNAIKELQTIPQIIGANNSRSYEIAESFFREITPTILKVKSLEASELIKLFNNTYRDIHFSIGNYFNEIAQSFGINGIELINASNYGYQRSNIAKPGLVGGACLEKDSYILVHKMKASEGKDFVLRARNYNESLEDKIVEWALRKMGEHNIKAVGVSGLAFKGIPSTSDLRGSNSVSIVKKLKQSGIDVSVHDFVCSNKQLNEFGSVYDDIYDMTENVGLLLILNNNINYGELDIMEIDRRMLTPKVVFDCWKSLDNSSLKKNVNLVTLGDMDLIDE